MRPAAVRPRRARARRYAPRRVLSLHGLRRGRGLQVLPGPRPRRPAAPAVRDGLLQAPRPALRKVRRRSARRIHPGLWQKVPREPLSVLAVLQSLQEGRFHLRAQWCHFLPISLCHALRIQVRVVPDGGAKEIHRSHQEREHGAMASRLLPHIPVLERENGAKKSCFRGRCGGACQ